MQIKPPRQWSDIPYIHTILIIYMNILYIIICHLSIPQGAMHSIWVRSWRCGCLATWFCCQMTAKPGSKTVAPSWPDPSYAQGFAVICFDYIFSNEFMNPPIFFSIASVALGQSYFPSAREVILKDMGIIGWYLTTTKHNKMGTVHLFFWMCCTVCTRNRSINMVDLLHYEWHASHPTWPWN